MAAAGLMEGYCLRRSLFGEREIGELWAAGASFELQFSSLQTQFDVFRVLRRVVAEFDLRAFMVMRLPKVPSDLLSSLSIITSWPAEMLSKYDEYGLLQQSPVLKQLQSSVVPFKFDLEAIPEAQRKGVVPIARDLFIHYGLQRGVYLPVHDAQGNRGTVIFSGDRAALAATEIMQLQMVATLIYDRLSQLEYVDEKPPEALTAREIDCLIWTSAGKTSSEISEILALSEHTVNHYLNRAAKKLGTVNRTQAVAKALRIGLIR
jgi:LuxR family transcriptional regulator, quorum-sensing system regulator BjaR1